MIGKVLLACISVASLWFYFNDPEEFYTESNNWNIRNFAVSKIFRGQLSGASKSDLKILLGEPVEICKDGNSDVYIYELAGDYRAFKASDKAIYAERAKHPDVIFGVCAAFSPNGKFWCLSVSNDTVQRAWFSYHNRYI